MANKKVLHKRSNIEGKAPTSDQLDYGELAINYNAGNEQLYIKNSDNAIVGLISQGGGGDITSVTASGTSPLTLSASKDGTSVAITGSIANATASTAGVVKPYTVLSSAPSVNSATTTSGRYYGVSTNSNNALVVNVPWTDTTSSLSDLGGVGSVSASGTSPLTLSASKSGTTVTISGSVDLSSKQDVLTAGDNITISSSNVISADVPVTKWYDLWVSAYDIQYTGSTYTPSTIEACVYSYNDTTTGPLIESNVKYEVEMTTKSGATVSYFAETSSEKVSISLPTTQYLLITIIATLQTGMVLTKQLYCHTNSNWNYYLFEGGSSASTVTIDGSSVSVPANTIVEGNFTNDITAIGTNNLKRIIIRGDVSLSICSSSSSSNTTLEEVDLTFSPNYSRSFDYMFYKLESLRRLKMSGVQITGAQYMCSGLSYCDINIDACSWPVSSSTSGMNYTFYNSEIYSLNLSTFSFKSYMAYTFAESVIYNLNLSGCIFGNNLERLFYDATIHNLNLNGCDLRSVQSINNIFNDASIYSLNVNGLRLPSDTRLTNDLLNGLNKANNIVGISGSLGLNTISDSTQGGINLSSIDLDRQSLLTIFSSLNSESSLEAILLGYTTITLSSNSYKTLTSYDIAVATDKNWVVTY